MAINVLWNRHCGPGGGTRRLHHKQTESHFIEVDDLESAFDGGEIGSTGCSKGTSRPMQTLDANDNAPLVMALAA